jgi:glucosamine-6-phosphate deaminase
MQEKIIENLRVRIYESRSAMGAGAATDVGDKINDLLAHKEFVNIIFAAAPSQNEFLYHLSKRQDVCWNRVNAFHMDEYIGLRKDSPERFGNFLKEKLFDKVSFHAIYYINGDASGIEAECEKYTAFLIQNPPDIVCMGIGVNTHIAFNDPHVADFNDPQLVKKVELDHVCRQQQVDDGCFDDLSKVPTFAITLTIPALIKANHIYCIVPGINKSSAVYHTINNEMNERYPSTALRKHLNATLYLDMDSSVDLQRTEI